MINYEIIAALVGLTGAIVNKGRCEETDKLVLEAVAGMVYAEERDNFRETGNRSAAEESVNQINKKNTEEMVERIHKERNRLSPGCASCGSPCGNTSDVKISLFTDCSSDKRKIKDELIIGLSEAAKADLDRIGNGGSSANFDSPKAEKWELPELYYRAITILGMDCDADRYEEMLGEIQDLS